MDRRSFIRSLIGAPVAAAGAVLASHPGSAKTVEAETVDVTVDFASHDWVSLEEVQRSIQHYHRAHLAEDIRRIDRDRKVRGI